MESLFELLEVAVSSPWLYALVVAVVAADSVVPVLPGETIVITAGAYAAALGTPQVLPLVLAALVGALLGDIAAHHIGRGAGPLARRVRGVRIGQKLFDWAEDGLLRRGGPVILVARFIPGGRTATNIASGVIGYPRPTFLIIAGIAGLAWSIYYVAVGYAGGTLFQDDPLIGVVLGVGLAAVIGLLIERVRVIRARRADPPTSSGATAPPAGRGGSPVAGTAPPAQPAVPPSHDPSSPSAPHSRSRPARVR